MAPDCKVFTQMQAGRGLPRYCSRGRTSVVASKKEEWKKNRHKTGGEWWLGRRGCPHFGRSRQEINTINVRARTHTHTPCVCVCLSLTEHTLPKTTAVSIQSHLALLPSSHLALWSCDLFHCWSLFNRHASTDCPPYMDRWIKKKGGPQNGLPHDAPNAQHTSIRLQPRSTPNSIDYHSDPHTLKDL